MGSNRLRTWSIGKPAILLDEGCKQKDAAKFEAFLDDVGWTHMPRRKPLIRRAWRIAGAFKLWHFDKY